jgi:hypothetical protein
MTLGECEHIFLKNRSINPTGELDVRNNHPIGVCPMASIKKTLKITD